MKKKRDLLSASCARQYSKCFVYNNSQNLSPRIQLYDLSQFRDEKNNTRDAESSVGHIPTVLTELYIFTRDILA